MPLGTLINAAAIVVGSVAGIFFRHLITDRLKQIVFQAIGLSTLLIGTQMALRVENILIVIFSMMVGGLVGEALQLEAKLESLGGHFKRMARSEDSRFTQGFVSATILFCIGSMAILGPLEEGLTGKRDILLTKSMLDGFSSIAFAATFGIGTAFSAVPLFLYQGGLTLLSTQLAPYTTPFLINQLSAVGGLLIVGIGFNMLEIKAIRVTNLLPALAVVVLLSAVLGN